MLKACLFRWVQLASIAWLANVAFSICIEHKESSNVLTFLSVQASERWIITDFQCFCIRKSNENWWVHFYSLRHRCRVNDLPHGLMVIVRACENGYNLNYDSCTQQFHPHWLLWIIDVWIIALLHSWTKTIAGLRLASGMLAMRGMWQTIGSRTSCRT